MEFKQHIGVLTVDAEEAGRLDRVVINPETNEVTHLVVQQGILSPTNKVIPIELVEVGDENGVVLRVTADEVAQLPDFEEKLYVAVDEAKLGRGGPNNSPLPDTLLYWQPIYPQPPLLPQAGEPAYRVETQTNIPPGTIAVKEGAKVITRDGKHKGSIDEVLTADNGGRVTHLLISTGVWHKGKKLIPVNWVDEMSEDEVRLIIGAYTVDRLPEYEPA